MATDTTNVRVYPTITSGSILGGVVGVIKNHLINKLPKNFIKNVFITNSIPSISEEYYNDDTEILKQFPLLSIGIGMEYEPSEAERFDTVRLGVKHVPKQTWLNTSVYRRFLLNLEDGVFITALVSRLKVTLNIGLRVESEIQAFNIVSFLRNNIGIDRPYFISKIHMEIPIPLEVLDDVFVSSKINKTDSDWKNKFKDYVLKWSAGSITVKKNLSTGNFNFFVKYPCNILTKIPSMPSIQKNMDGKSVLNTDITWNIEVDLPFFSNFIVESNTEEIVDSPFSDGFTSECVVFNYAYKTELERQSNGKSLYKILEFISEINVSIDKTDITDSIEENVKEFLLSKFKEGNINDVVEIKLFRDEKQLNDTQYFVDWEKLTVLLIDPLFNYVYRLGLYVDVLAYNQFLKDKFAPKNFKEIIEGGSF